MAQQHFNFKDADVILECRGVSLDQPDKQQTFELRVHRQTLAAQSTFFQGMFETAGQDTKADHDADLPRVAMQEEIDVVNILLGAAYNLPEVQAIIATSKDWAFILKVWEAANKYGMHLLRTLTSTLLLFVCLTKLRKFT